MGYPAGDLCDQLAHVGAAAVRSGLVVGSGGNLSARMPGTDECWITASGTWLDHLEPTEFSLVTVPDGRWCGGHPVPSSEWRLHTEIYARRHDVNAIIHLHPQLSVLLTALGHDIALITTDQAYYLRRIATIPYLRPGTADVGVTAAEAAADGVNILVLGQHGCCVLGDSVELAHKRVLNLEEAARTTYAALLLTGGDPARVPRVPASFLDAVGPDTGGPI